MIVLFRTKYDSIIDINYLSLPYCIEGGGGKLNHVTQNYVKSACVRTITTLI